MKKKTAPIRGAGPGRLVQEQNLLRCKVLVIAEADYVLEHRTELQHLNMPVAYCE